MLEPNDVLNELQDLSDNGFLSDALLRRAVKDIEASDDRFEHSPNEMVSLSDLESTARLLAAFVSSLDGDTDFTPR